MQAIKKLELLSSLTDKFKSLSRKHRQFFFQVKIKLWLLGLPEPRNNLRVQSLLPLGSPGAPSAITIKSNDSRVNRQTRCRDFGSQKYIWPHQTGSAVTFNWIALCQNKVLTIKKVNPN